MSQENDLEITHKKKIQKGFFKDGPVLKSDKCNLTRNSDVKSVKMYICKRSLNFVVRPERKSMFSFKIDQMNDIRSDDDRKIYITTSTNDVYLLSDFKKPDSVSFIMGYCGRNRTNKLIDARADEISQKSAPTYLTINEGSELQMSPICRNHIFTQLSSDSFSKCSPKSGISTTDSESINNSCMSESLLPLRKSSSRASISISSLEQLNCNDGDGSVDSFSPTNDPAMEASNPNHENNRTLTRFDDVAVVSSSRPNDDTQRRIDVNDNSNKYLQNGQQQQQQSYSSRPSSPSTNCNNWWPLDLFNMIFSNFHQRSTMFIAYVILAFLLLSTMHLYHRLAVIDLNTNIPTAHHLTLTNGDATDKQVGGLAESLTSLERHLIQLTELTGRITRDLASLSDELRVHFTRQTADSTTTGDVGGLNDF